MSWWKGDSMEKVIAFTIVCVFVSVGICFGSWWKWSYLDHQKEGFKAFNKAFECHEETTGVVNKTIGLTIEIQVVDNAVMFRIEDKVAGQVGYASNNGRNMGVLGRYHKGKIILNQAAIGHELNHLLNFADPEIMNPDEMEK